MKRIFLIAIFLWIFFPYVLLSKVWINEMMQSNIDLVRDDLREFPDGWIELYNDSDQAVNIQNWVISDEPNYRNGWKIIVSTVISPKSYLLLYADKVADGLHTDFRLDVAGGSVYLFDASGNQIDAITNIPKQPAPNIAFGRISDGNADWAHFVTATPGKTNTGKTSNTLLPPPVFSQAGGIFKSSVNVSLSLPASGVPASVALSNIRYTLDGSEPTASSQTYTGPLSINSTTVVRAKLIHLDYLCDRSTVHTYIIEPTRNMGLPVISISTDPEYWDCGAFQFNNWNDQMNAAWTNCPFGIYKHKNDPLRNNKWRRPINLEYFPKEGSSSVLNQLCEFRIAGGASRVYWQRNMVVYANKRFGNNRFEYDIFKAKPGQEIKSFMIRNSGNDHEYSFFRDAAMQLFFGRKVDVDYQEYEPAIIYLNGQYWGMMNLRERSTQDLILANYGLKDTEIDLIKDRSVRAGDYEAWEQLEYEIDRGNYEWVMNHVDIDEFINYMILQIYVRNTDFPHNNRNFWRPRTPDGKWRFILKDTDMGLGLWDTPASHNTLAYNASDPDPNYAPTARKLLKFLLTHDAFKKKFYGRFAVYMGDLLHYNSTSQVIDSIKNLIEPFHKDALARWTPPRQNCTTIASWQNEVNKMKTWCLQRNGNVYRHLQTFFDLGTIMKLTFEKADDLKGTPAVYINGICMRNSGLDASYFQKEFVELQHYGDERYYGWEITQTVSGKTDMDTIRQPNLSYQIVDGCASVNIRLVNVPYEPIVITKVEQLEHTSPEPIFYVFNGQLQIFGLQPNSVISVYDLAGKLIAKTSTSNSSVSIPLRQMGIYIVTVQHKTQIITRKVSFII